MKGRRVVGILGAALALGLIVGGCGGGGNGGSNKVTVSGDAFYPPANGGDPVRNVRFIIIDPDRPDDPLATDDSTLVGRYFGVIRKTVSVAVILFGAVDDEAIRVSGLIPAESNNNGKQLDGQTDIACEAGVQAVIDGDIIGNDLDAERIQNLEDAAARFVATTDFTDPLSVTAAANQVRALTNNGEHPAP